MKILFLSYCGSDGNSLPHIAGFARELDQLEGVDSVTIALPGRRLVGDRAMEILAEQGLERAAKRGSLRLLAHGEVLHGISAGDTYDVLHLWTPREITRRWLMSAAMLWPAAAEHPWPLVVVHLEDNEEALAQRHFGSREAWEAAVMDREKPIPMGVAHPRHYQNLCAMAEGATVIWETLAEFVPPTTPAMELMPGIDLTFFAPRPPDAALCARLGLKPMAWADFPRLRSGLPGAPRPEGEIVVCYNGNTTTANQADMIALYTALHALRAEGWPLRLLRTGRDAVEIVPELGFDPTPWVTNLGFVPRGELPAIYSLAHLFIQPGPPDEFNAYRLPSKLPEYLASGGVCVLPAANLGLRLRDGVEALVLQRGDAPEIVERVRAFFQDPEQAVLMGQRARRFAQSYFDAQRQAAYLLGFYQQCLAGIRNMAGGKRGNALSTPGFACLAGAGRERSTPYIDADRELVSARAASSMLADRLHEVLDQEIPTLREEIKTLKDALGKTAKTAAKNVEKLDEITSSKTWRAVGKRLLKFEKKRRKSE